MLRHTEASAVVEYAYNDKAILEQRNMLTEELYGNIFQVYKVIIATLFFLKNNLSFSLCDLTSEMTFEFWEKRTGRQVRKNKLVPRNLCIPYAILCLFGAYIPLASLMNLRFFHWVE